MKVLHALETLSPRYGGPVSVLLALAEAQQRVGHEVTIVTTNADHPCGVFCEPGWDSLAQAGVSVYYAPVQFAPLRFSRQFAAFVRRAVAQFDVVHIHGLYRFPPTCAAWEARRQGVPYVIRPHGALDPYLYARSSSRTLCFKRLYEHWFDLPNQRRSSMRCVPRAGLGFPSAGRCVGLLRTRAVRASALF